MKRFISSKTTTTIAQDVFLTNTTLIALGCLGSSALKNKGCNKNKQGSNLKLKTLKLNVWLGAARTQAPSNTNYDVGSTTWADLRLAPLQSAMEVTNLDHGPH